LLQMFDNVLKLKFELNANKVLYVSAMISSEGEVMLFRNAIDFDGKIEDKMVLVEEEMRRSNRLLTKEATFYYCDGKARVDWMFDYQGMMVLAANQIWFTWEVEDVFRKIRMGQKTAL